MRFESVRTVSGRCACVGQTDNTYVVARSAAFLLFASGLNELY